MMKRRYLIIIIIIIAVGLGTAYLLYRKPGGDSPKNGFQNSQPKNAEVVARVKIVPVRRGTITEDVTVHGVITAASGAVQTLSVPFESVVRALLVSAGQRVLKGDKLLDIEPSPATLLKFNQTQNAYRKEKENLAHIREQYNLRLATNSQLLDARQKFEQARLEYQNLKQRRANKGQTLYADTDGLVGKVSVQEGAVVPASSPFLELIAQSRLEAVFGVETADVNNVRANQSVSVTSLNQASILPATGTIRKISSAVNPATRLVDIFVSLPRYSGFLLGQAVLGKIKIASSEGLIVPRSSVLPEDDHYVFYTVRDSRAVKHIVQVGLESEKEAQIIGADIHTGDLAVMTGNYELKSGMAVTTGT